MTQRTAGLSDLEALADATAYLTERLGTILEAHWALPTPCDDWDLRALVDHVTGGNWFTLSLLSGATADKALDQAMARFVGGSPTADESAESAARQLDAFRAPGVLDASWPHMVGDLTGAEVLRLRVHDLAIHAWDVDRSINPAAELPEGLAVWGLAELSSGHSQAMTHFAPASRQPADASLPAVRYLVRMGRSPGPGTLDQSGRADQ